MQQSTRRRLPPTAQTRRAGVIPREPDQEPLRVEGSPVASTWIGETGERLGEVVAGAPPAHAPTRFEEADALVAHPTEVKCSVDRRAKLEVDDLLQRLEAFSGVTIRTTHCEDPIDAALERRLTLPVGLEEPAAARAAPRRWGLPSSGALAAAGVPERQPRELASLTASLSGPGDGPGGPLTHRRSSRRG